MKGNQIKGNQMKVDHKKKKIASALALSLGTAALACGCGNSAKDSGKGMKMLMTISQMDTFRLTLAGGAQQAAADAGIQLEVLDAENVTISALTAWASLTITTWRSAIIG